ncbi:MAG: hypothetical protein ABT940_03100 [Alphaproteobacteria bacterium]
MSARRPRPPKHPFHWDRYSALYDRFQCLAGNLADASTALHTAEHLPEDQRRSVAAAVKKAQRATEHAQHLLQQAWSLQAELEGRHG